MPKITHTLDMVDAYEFSKEDFERHGIDDQGDVKFNAANLKTAEVSDAAAEYILENHPEFKLTSKLTKKQAESAGVDKDADQDAAPVSKTEAGATAAGSVAESAADAKAKSK